MDISSGPDHYKFTKNKLVCNVSIMLIFKPQTEVLVYKTAMIILWQVGITVLGMALNTTVAFSF